MKKLLLAVGGIILVSITYYGISPLWKNIRVDDALPLMMATSTDAFLGYPITDTAAHPASGTVKVLKTEAGSVIRYEDYKTINGPNLHIYLSKELDAKEYIDLGPIKGTEGNINYEVPAGVDVSAYRYVLTWCKPFGVLFNYAEIK